VNALERFRDEQIVSRGTQWRENTKVAFKPLCVLGLARLGRPKNKCLAHRNKTRTAGKATHKQSLTSAHTGRPRSVQIGAASAAKCMAAPHCRRGPTKRNSTSTVDGAEEQHPKRPRSVSAPTRG
jgi:hypothetical protein